MTANITVDEAQDAILAEFKQYFVGVDANHVAWPNREYEPTDGQAYVRISVQHNLAYQPSMGDPAARRTRREGIVFVQCFTPLGDGTSQSNELAQEASDVLSNKRVAVGGVYHISLKSGEIRTIGRDPVHELWQVNVSVPFWYDQIP